MKEKAASAQYENRLNQPETMYLLDKILPEHKFQGRLLEIGAGSCWASTLIKQDSPSTTVIASDISTEDLRIGKKAAHDLGSGADLYVACAAEKLPFQSNSFDFVFSNAVIHHLNDAQEGIQEIHRILKTDGKYVGSGEPMGSIFIKKIWRNRLLVKAIRRNTSEETLFTFKDLQRNFNSSGFDRFEIKQETSWQCKTSDYTPGIRSRIYRLMASKLPDFIVNHFLLTEIDVVAIKH